MEEVNVEEKKLENEENKSNKSINNEEKQNQELIVEINEKVEDKENNYKLNNENSGILNDKIESNISEINNKNEDNDSQLQKEINVINNEINSKEKKKKTDNTKKDKKLKSKIILSKNINKIINHKTANKDNKNTNFEEIVYSHNRFHNNNILNYIKQKEINEISECSFKPKINKKKGLETNKQENKNENKENNGSSSKNNDVVERLLLWKERVKQKISNIKDKRDKEELEKDKCTFFPKLKTDVPKFDKKEISGNEKYYNRIKNSREIKMELEKMLNPDYDKLYNKYYKDKEKTVLKKNQKVSKKTYQNYLNHFHNVLMNDDE